MSHAVEFIKEHPWKIAAGVFVVGILYLLVSSSGGSNTTVVAGATGPTPDEVQSATQLQLATVQANSQANQVAAAASVQNNTTAAGVTIAQLQASYETNNATLQAQVAEAVAQLTASTNVSIATLQANVENNQTAAQVQTTQINDNALIQVALAPYNADFIRLQDAYTNLSSQNGTLTSEYNSTKTALDNVIGYLPSLDTVNGQAAADAWRRTIINAGSTYTNAVAAAQHAG